MKWTPLAIALLLLSPFFTSYAHAQAQPDAFSAQGSLEFPKTDFDNTSIDFSEIMSGGPPRDGIPAIDSPEFISAESAAQWLGDNEPVISLQMDGTARAYPLQILMYHEIVNDVIAGKPVTVTFCPLCNASIVFDANVDGQSLDFGTTGRLRNSDLVMYDRQSETWWQQFTGTGIVGDFNGVRLNRIPSQIISFETFRKAFPDGEILSRNTGFSRQYGNNPYTGYDDINSNPFLYTGDIDPRLPPMERVLAIAEEAASDKWQLVPLSTLESRPIIQLGEVVVVATSFASSALDKSDIASSRLIPAAAAFKASIDGKPVTLSLSDEGQLVDEQTGSQWSPLGQAISGPMEGSQLQQVDDGVHFAFAWLAFDPDASVVK